MHGRDHVEAFCKENSLPYRERKKNIMQERKLNPFQQTRQDEKRRRNCKKVQKKAAKKKERLQESSNGRGRKVGWSRENDA